MISAALILAWFPTSLPNTSVHSELKSNEELVKEARQNMQRANQFGQRFNGKVLNDRLRYGWFSNSKKFWFREDKRLSGSSKVGRHFFMVDIASGTKQSAFDHAKVAELLKKKSVDTTAETLPIETLNFREDGQQVTLVGSNQFVVDLNRYELVEGGTTTGIGLAPFSPQELTRSVSGGESVTIGFINNSSESLRISWLQEDGVPREYNVLKPKDSWSIPTYENHYWLVSRLNNEPLAVYKPGPSGGTAFLDGNRARPNRAGSNRSNTRQNGERQNGDPNGWQVRVQDVNGKSQLISTTNGETKTIPAPTGYRFRPRAYFYPSQKAALVFMESIVPVRQLNIVQTTPKNQIQPVLTNRDYVKPGDPLPQIVPSVVSISGEWKAYDIEADAVAKAAFDSPFETTFRGFFNDEALIHVNRRGHQSFNLYGVKPDLSPPRTIIEETSPTFIDWTAKSYLNLNLDRGEAIWQSERSGWTHVYRYDLKTGKVLNPITSGDWVFRRMETVQWGDQSSETGTIEFMAGGMNLNEDPYHMHLCRAKLTGGPVQKLTEGNGNHTVQWSPDGQTFLDTYSRADMAPVYELRTKDGKLVQSLTAADPTPATEAGFRIPRVYSFKGRDGKTDIWGIVHLPTQFDPSKKYPVVENIYAGPHSSHVPKVWQTNSSAMQMAELGFIVVRIDGMGTSNRNKAFHDVCWQNLADAGFEDRKIWIKEAAKKIPQMDLTRVGIFGTSAGGQNTLHALLLHPEFYKVGIADCGCYDNRMDKIWWNEQWMGYPIGPHYEAQSGRTLAKNLQGKLMLMLGEMDTNVDPASTYQVIDALVAANKDFEFLVLPNVGHGAIGSPYGKRKAQEFLIRWLHGIQL